MNDAPKIKARVGGLLVTRFVLSPTMAENTVPLGGFGWIKLANHANDYVLEVTVRALRIRKRKHRRTRPAAAAP